MKMLKCLAIIFALILFPAYLYPQALGSLRLSLIKGDVQIRTEDAEDWVPASINMPLVDGDRIWVPEGGRTELQLREGTILRLDENSALEILTVEKESYQFYLTEGRGYVNFIGSKGGFLQIDTPVSSSRAYEKSLFRIDVTPDGYTGISVYRGSVSAESRDGGARVETGKTLSLREGSYAELSPLPAPDEWERWNKERDRKLLARRPPAQYLPEELYPYANDFEENGRWVQVREYGYVWTPRVVVSAGWAPYRVGRWVWFRGDYIWVSYESWGWVPYHYGRWVFVPPIGWCWVPPGRGAVYWGPGFVGWVHTPTYVSWVPLAPGEIYYGYGYYGPHSVNVTQINIRQINVQKVVYKNIHVHNAVTVVHQDTFLKGKQVEVKAKENPFLGEKISIGRPDIKPEKATVMPIIKEIPQTKRPPEPIREIKVKQLKQERPLVKEKEVSVLKPESPPKKMPLRTIEKKEVERPKEFKPTEKQIQKPAPVEKGLEKPREFKPTEKEVRKPEQSKPTEGGVKPQEFKPTEKQIQKPGPVEKGLEKPKEFKPAEKEVRKEEQSKPAESDATPREFKPPERGMEKPISVEKETEKSRERKPPEKKIEKQEHRPAEKE